MKKFKSLMAEKNLYLRIARWATFGAASLMFIDSLVRMFWFGSEEDPYFFILTFYLLGFASLLAVAELRLKRVLVYIEFLRSRLGKGIYIIIVGFLLFDVSRIFDLLVACLLILIGVG